MNRLESGFGDVFRLMERLPREEAHKAANDERERDALEKYEEIDSLLEAMKTSRSNLKTAVSQRQSKISKLKEDIAKFKTKGDSRRKELESLEYEKYKAKKDLEMLKALNREREEVVRALQLRESALTDASKVRRVL